MTFKSLIKKTCGLKLALLLALPAVFISSCQKETAVTPEAATTSQSASSLIGTEATAKSLVKLATTTTTFLGAPINSTAPISLYKKSNVTISGASITGGSAPCIQLTNCTNIHITKCKLTGSTNYGILIGSGCSNILIDSCLITNVATGVFAVSCPNGQIRVQYNQFQNMKGPYPKGDYVQFSNVGGHYNRIQYNTGENISGQSNPEDGISIYKSNGVAGDPICVIGNSLRGGGPSTTGSGITVGDQGGSYILVQNNKLVNTGYMGMQVAGGHDIQLTGNNITSTAFAWSHQGLGCGNYSGLSSYSITINANQVKWISGKASDQLKGSTSIEKDASYQVGTTMPTGWSTNVLGAAISSTILPSTLITWY